jgi:hypothetical protein
MDGALATAGHHMGIQTRDCKYSLELLMMMSAKHVEPSINFGIITVHNQTPDGRVLHTHRRTDNIQPQTGI